MNISSSPSWASTNPRNRRLSQLPTNGLYGSTGPTKPFLSVLESDFGRG